MQGRSAGFICRLLPVAAMLVYAGAADSEDPGVIVKPRDGTWLPGKDIDIIAKVAEGRLLLDGAPIDAAEPFPSVLYARVSLEAGGHALRLESASGSTEVQFHVGEPPQGVAVDPYVDHPPFQTACTHCHSLSSRGRFRFSGGCQACHAKEKFIQSHSHEPHELASCGMCHDAHGSSTAKLLILSQDVACKQCHN